MPKPPIPPYWPTRNLLLTAPKGGHFRGRGKTLTLCRDCAGKLGSARLIAALAAFGARDAGITGNCDHCGQALTALPEGE